ncbi:MAG: hypothetical protein ACE5KT_07455 [Methanosarcinales archaeon]
MIKIDPIALETYHNSVKLIEDYGIKPKKPEIGIVDLQFFIKYWKNKEENPIIAKLFAEQT